MRFLHPLIIVVTLLISSISYSQSLTYPASKWHLTAGYGPAYNFFVTSYVENESPGETSFLKKNSIGKHLNVSIIRELKKFELSLGYSFEEFKKHVKYDTVIPPVVLTIDHSIHHINNIFDLTLKRKFEKNSHLFGTGIGVYYLRSIQQEISLTNNAYTEILILDRNFKNSYLEELGGLVDLSYEYKFQSRAYLGLKAQFFFTISTGEPESITLFPYIKLLF